MVTEDHSGAGPPAGPLPILDRTEGGGAALPLLALALLALMLLASCLPG